MRRFFTTVASVIEKDSPATAEKLRRASPHWMRHTHATHALARGAELITVRDNLRHASVATTLIYLHTDEIKRARRWGMRLRTPVDCPVHGHLNVKTILRTSGHDFA